MHRVRRVERIWGYADRNSFLSLICEWKQTTITLKFANGPLIATEENKSDCFVIKKSKHNNQTIQTKCSIKYPSNIQ